MKKVFTLIVLCVFSIGTIHAKITWSLSDDGTLTISGTDMPNYLYNEVPWYSQRDKIKKVVIKNGVKNIGKYAFNECSSLSSITIPNSVTSIGEYAFYYCSGLTSITIPNSVTSIGEAAFLFCSGLTSINIPNSVTSIGDGAFGECTNLTSITIHNSMIFIDSHVFNNCPITDADINIGLYNRILTICPKITYITITIPYGETRIESSTFYGKSKITSVQIPNSVTSIGYEAFSGCSNLTSITIPNSVTSIEQRAFYNCSSLTSVKIPNSVTSIEQRAFFGCSGLTSITIPNSVTSIKSETFSGCSNLTSITIPNSVTSIEQRAFYNCSSLTSVKIPNSVTSIEQRAFFGCSGLTSITIPNSVTSIKSETFSGCSSLTSITIPNSVTSIGEGAFSYCQNLTSINIPNSVTYIGNRAFNETKWYNDQPDGLVYAGLILYNNKGTMPVNSNVLIKKGTKRIENKAFSGCFGLTSITIPSSVESVGANAFKDCYNLQSITITNPTPPSCEEKNIFECSTSYVRDKYDVYNYTTLHIPMGSKEAYSSAQEWRYFNKVKEDMEIDGNVYYAKLAVKQGTTGYTELPVKADETYTIYIGALGNSKINAVTFNGEDVTDKVKDGYYTTPAIKAKSVLSISYEDINTTNVKEISNPDLKVIGNEGEISIKGIEQPTNVEVYTTDGKLVETRGSVYGDTNIQVKEDNLYLVKVGKRAIKIAM